MNLIFAYLAGLLTLINPCVLPVLPIVLASALQAHRYGPLALSAGMSVSFVALGLAVASAGQVLGLGERQLAQAGAVAMIGFGLVLLIPRLNAGFALATAGFAAQADARLGTGQANDLPGQAMTGLLLGAVWSPCIGPTLGGAIGLASQGGSLVQAGAIMVAFAAGVASMMLVLAYGTRAAIGRRRARLAGLSAWAKPIMGAVLVAVGLAIFFRLHHVVEAWAVQSWPVWLQDLSVRF